MGVKTNVAAISPTAAHASVAATSGRNATSMHQQAGAQIVDTINLLTQIVKDLTKANPFSVSGATLNGGGASYAINEVLTFANGVTITVNTVSSGAIATFTVTAAGSLSGNVPPTNPQTQISSTGNGRTASFNFTWVSSDPNATAYLNAISALS
jgi:hypothetical protein